MQVYAIQNKVNQKIYFGQTVQDLDKYWQYNIRCALNNRNYKPALYRAIRKYSPDNFNIITIQEVNTKEDLDNLEKLCILVYGTNEEWCENISKGLTGQVWSEERKKASSESRKGKTLTEEHKKKIGEGVKGTKKPQQWLDKLIERNKARKGEKRKPRTPEHQAKLSASRIANRLARLELEKEATNGANTV